MPSEEVAAGMQSASASLAALTATVQRVSFLLLDLRWDLAAADQLPPVSWEVEREQFMRARDWA